MTPDTTMVLIAGIVKEHRAKRIDGDDALSAIRALAGIGQVGPAPVARTSQPVVASVAAPRMAEIRAAVGRPANRVPMAAPADPIDVDDPDGAMEAAMGPQLADYRAGRMDRDAVMQIAEIRGPQIRQLRATPPVAPRPCVICGEASDATIGGLTYCGIHAANAPRENPLEGGGE